MSSAQRTKSETPETEAPPLMSPKQLHKRIRRLAMELSRVSYEAHKRQVKADLLQVAKQGGDVPLALAEMELGALQQIAAGIVGKPRSAPSTSTRVVRAGGGTSTEATTDAANPRGR